MEKTFRGKITKQEKPDNKGMADTSVIPWPCIAGPKVPDKDPKLWKATRLDMNSSLAFLRRELAAMQLQDRAIHKQLLKLNSSILSLKTSLNESWEQQEEQKEIEAVCYPTETCSVVTRVEVLNSTNPESQGTQVSHAKQDSGILTDEESDEETDVFVSEPTKPTRHNKVRSVSVINLPTYHSSINIDINNNHRTPSMRPTKTNASSTKATFQGFNLSLPRSRPHAFSEGQFHRVTSMPVINENPGQDSTTSRFSGKAFAIYGFVNEDNMNNGGRSFSHDFQPLSRHESMPIISGFDSGGHIGRNLHHSRSQTEPGQSPLHRGRFNSSFSGHHSAQIERPITRASSQMDLRKIDQPQVKPYRIYRTSSQVSLV